LNPDQVDSEKGLERAKALAQGRLRFAANVTDRLWEVGDIVALVEATDAKPDKHGPYKKRMGRMRKHYQGIEGRIVQVIDGPFTGFRGEVKEVDEQTVKVDVQTFGRVTPVELALRQIELVPRNSN